MNEYTVNYVTPEGLHISVLFKDGKQYSVTYLCEEVEAMVKKDTQDKLDAANTLQQITEAMRKSNEH